MHMVSTWVRVSGLLVVRKQINRNWANQLPWLPRELVFSEWKNVSCSSIHPSLILPAGCCWFTTKGQSEPAPTSTEPMQDGWMVCGQETSFHWSPQHKWMRTEAKWTGRESLCWVQHFLRQQKSNPKIILFYFKKPPMQTKDLVSRYLYINLGKWSPLIYPSLPPWHYSYKRNERVSNKLGGRGRREGGSIRGLLKQG